MFYSRSKKETKAVIQCVTAAYLSSAPEINAYKVNRLIIDGYSMDTTTANLIDKKNIKLFNKSYCEACYESRSFVKSYLHILLSALILNEDYTRKEYATDIKNAYLFTYERAPKRIFDSYIAVFNDRDQQDSLQIEPENVNMINRANEYFTSRGIKYYLVLLPISSYASKYLLPKNYKEAIEASNLKCDVIDCSTLLDDDCFADPSHPNRKGASILSKYIMDEMLRRDSIK